MDAQHVEQTKHLERDLTGLKADIQKVDHRLDRHLEIYAQNGKELAALKQEVSDMKTSLNTKCGEIMKAVESGNRHSVSKSEFFPVKLLTFGAAGLMLMGVMGALVTLVVK